MRWSSWFSRSTGRSHFSLQALLECTSPSLCVVCMLETESVSSPEASHLNPVWKWTSCQSSTQRCLGKWGDSSVSCWAVGGRPGCDSLQYRTQHLHNALTPERALRWRVEGRRWKNNICEHQKRNPSAIHICFNKTNWQKDTVSAFLLSILHLLLSVLLKIYSREARPPPLPSTPLFASSWQSLASWNIPLQIVSLSQCCLSFFHRRRGLGHTHLSLWTSCPAPSVHCPLDTHTHTHTQSNPGTKNVTVTGKDIMEEFMFIGLCQK